MLTTLIPGTRLDNNTSFVPISLGPTASYTAPSFTLRDAVIEANYLFNTVNPGVANTISLKAGTYTLSVANASTGYETASKSGDLNINGNLTIQGVGVATVPLTTINQTAADRVFAVNTPGLTVNFNNLAITGGKAVDDAVSGTLPGTSTAEGGGIWASGDTLALSTVTFQGDSAVGGAGTSAAAGQNAEGGGLYDSGGLSLQVRGSTTKVPAVSSTSTLSLTNVTFQSNSATGGAGFNGISTTPAGGAGGGAYGGAVYTSNVVVTLSGTVTFNSNQAIGGAGGNGYSGSTVGGAGGLGGVAEGGAVDMYFGSLSEVGSSTLANFIGNKALGGAGGNGGNGVQTGGNAGTQYGNSGGYTVGGGLYADATAITLKGGSVISNLARGGAGGSGGSGASKGGLGGTGGGAGSGALEDDTPYDSSTYGTVTLTQVTVSGNTAASGVGGAGGAGTGASGVGGNGGDAGYADGAAFTMGYDTTMTLNAVTVTGNVTQGGNGGNGGKGGATGQGGNGGSAADGANVYGNGGAILSYGNLTVCGGSISANRDYGGNGGNGGNAGTGGQGGGGGGVQGGGIDDWTDDDPGALYLYGASVNGNLAQAGNGGNGGNSSARSVAGGAGGVGGSAEGGALYIYYYGTATITTSTTTVGNTSIKTPTTLVGNWALGGNGGYGGSGSTVKLLGSAGAGGNADGGGLSTPYYGYVYVTSALIEANIVQGGNGGLIGAQGSGAGGSAFGGGISYYYSILTLTSSSVIGNVAIAGLSYLGGGSGTASGGGIYLYTTSGFTDPGSTITGNSPNNIGP